MSNLKKNNESQILRDPITYKIYIEIMNSSKPKNVEKLSWARFKILNTIMFYTGLRLKEAGNITEKIIKELIDKNSAIISQNGKKRKLLVEEKAVNALKYLKYERLEVFPTLETKLYPYTATQGTGLIKLLNNFLKPYREKYDLNLKSHSYRINFVNETLKTNSSKNTQKLVGHNDIRSTLAYKKKYSYIN
jgi:site-specific recombinase XerD